MTPKILLYLAQMDGLPCLCSSQAFKASNCSPFCARGVINSEVRLVLCWNLENEESPVF